MRKKFSGRALPVVLSVALTATSVTVPVYATEDATAVSVESPADTSVDAETTAETPAAEQETTPDVTPEETPVEEQDVAPEVTPEEEPSDSDDPEEAEEKEDMEEEPTEEAEKVEKAMSSATVGGVTYYYVDTEGDAENTEYQASVTTGRGPSATTTVYPYTKEQLKQAGDSTVYYVVVSGTALSGTLYGYAENAEDDGTATTYSAVYGSLGASFDSAYDTVSSATGFTSYHAKDVPSVVTFGTDGSGSKAINGLKLGKGLKTVDAEAYVAASLLKAAGKELSEEQTEMLEIKLKQNPTDAPATAEGTVTVAAASASYTTSRYGDAEFDITFDDSLSGYVWSEYWDSIYAATVSDGSTTVGTVHWIDLYGEASTSGAHYNKVQIALNNGTSVAANAASVSRFAAFYDENTGNIKGGTYTVTIYADGYTPVSASVTVPTESMQSVSVGGVTYYYADTTDDNAMTVYQVSVTQGRGPSATTTVYNYTASDLTTIEGTGLAYIVAPGATALEGTLYGYGEGTATNYQDVYSALGLATDDPAYDAVTSATGFTSYHAKDVAGVVTYGTDASGAKAITGLTTGREVLTVDAKNYVESKIMEAGGADLSEDQEAALSIQLKKNPTVAPATETITVAAASATFTTSSFGVGEFDIIPDDTLEGFVWSEYWDNVYAATISNGKTTVGAVHWIDMYGEEATSGYHYNKLQIALNNGTSVGSNKAEVSRYAAFFNKDGTIKGGTYTITVYSDGYTPMTATVTVEGTDDSEATDNTYTVTASVLNVRKGPGTSYNTVGSLKKGTVVEVLETSGNWAKIDYNGTEAWVSAKYLQKNSSSDKEEESEDQPSAAATYKVFASALNVRKGAGTGYSVIGCLYYGDTVEVLETKNGWAKISYNGSYGWISMNYLAETSSSSTPSTSDTYKITASSLNVRSGAGLNYSVVGSVKKGDIVSVIETKDGWGKISINGNYGWVSMKYCQKQ